MKIILILFKIIVIWH